MLGFGSSLTDVIGIELPICDEFRENTLNWFAVYSDVNGGIADKEVAILDVGKSFVWGYDDDDRFKGLEGDN